MRQGWVIILAPVKKRIKQHTRQDVYIVHTRWRRGTWYKAVDGASYHIKATTDYQLKGLARVGASPKKRHPSLERPQDAALPWYLQDPMLQTAGSEQAGITARQRRKKYRWKLKLQTVVICSLLVACGT